MSRRRISSLNLDIDWNDESLVQQVKDIIDTETAKAAEIAYQTASKLCPVDTGELVNSLRVDKSMFPDDGSYLVRAQNPGTTDKEKKNFAIKVLAVEFGRHFLRGEELFAVAAQPFFRPAIKKVKRIFKKNMQQAIDNRL